MTTYKEIKGTQIEVVSSDPSNPVEGQVWYNSTDQAVKGLATTAAGAWATGGTTNQVRSQAAGSGADKDAALVFAGYTGTAATAKTENYDGSSWTEVNDVNTARRYIAGCGTNTAALCTGGTSGAPSVANEQWNGTNWTEVADMNVAREDIKSGGTGTVPAALAIGGEISTGPSAATEEWAAKVPTTVTFSDSE